MTYKSHAIVKVDSRQRKSTDNITDFQYYLDSPINFVNRSKDKQYFIRLENIKIPMSFYNVRDGYDTLLWQEDETILQFPIVSQIPHGNYSIDELVAEIQTQMNNDSQTGSTYLVSYDEIKQIIIVNGTAGALSLSYQFFADDEGEHFMEMLGVQEDTGIFAYGVNENISGDNAAYTNNWRYLKVFVDSLNSNNVYDTIGIRRVGIEVPVVVARNDYIYFKNTDGYYIKMANLPSINSIHIKLTDSFNKVLDLRGVNWSFDIAVYEWNKAGTDKYK